MCTEIGGSTAIDACRVDAYNRYLALDQQPRGFFRYAREMEVRGITRHGATQVFRGLGPVACPAGAHENGRIGANCPVSGFVGRDVFDRQKGVRVGGTLFDNVDDDPRSNQALERYVANRGSALGEMDRGIEMSPAVLAAREAVGTVPPELCTDSLCECGCVRSGLAVVVRW